MQTVSIPMSEFCDAAPELETDTIREIAFGFTDEGEPQSAMLDTVMFTSNQYDDVDGLCGTESGVFSCVASQTLVATETSCEGEPSAGQCPAGDVVTSSVALPWVDEGQGTTGWFIHAPMGPIQDVQNPTSAELDYLTDRCVMACENEWADNPAVSANCDASGAFSYLALVSTPSLGSRRAIPDAMIDGSGIFVGESLDCEDLHYDCCLEFDEDLCTSAPARVTPGPLPLGTNEEYVVMVDTAASEVESTSGRTFDRARLSGTVGYSFCRDGNATDSCPIYLGSLHLEASTTLTVDLECPDGHLETIDLEDLEIDLGQPAMGIHEGGTSNAAFPTRSLVFDATFEVDNQPVAIRGLSEVPVHVTADTTQFEALDIEFRGEAPCSNGAVGIATGTFDVELRVSASGIQEGPPTIDIDMTTTTTCGSSLNFSADTDDPDGDIVSTRWYVDDLLMSASTNSIEVNGSHTVRAVVRDARGASATDTVTIGCT